MEQKIRLGAIDKVSGVYVHPTQANKTTEYVCLECKHPVILCKGAINIVHFRHVTQNTSCLGCTSTGESEIHRAAKHILKIILDRYTCLLSSECTTCKKITKVKIPKINESNTISLEHRFEFNGIKIADVAYLENDNIKYIFEVFSMHITNSIDRPEPWYEIDAKQLIEIFEDRMDAMDAIHANAMNENRGSSDRVSEDIVELNCIRKFVCKDCILTQKLKNLKIKYAKYILVNWLLNSKVIKNDMDAFFDINIEGKTLLDITDTHIDIILYDDLLVACCYIMLVDAIPNKSYNILNKKYYIPSTKIYYFDINYIVSQVKPPKILQWLACISPLEPYEKMRCMACGLTYTVWIKKYFIGDICKDVCVGCACGLFYNTCNLHCMQCYEIGFIGERIQNKTSKLLCFDCDCQIIHSDKIYIDSEYFDRHTLKKLNATFDNLQKKWYIYKTNPNISVILSEFNRIYI